MEEASSSQPQSSHDIELGFRSLTLCSPKNNDQKLHHHSCIMASSLMSPPPSPAFSHIGDYIGMESCLDMKKCEDVQMMNGDANDDSTTMTTTTAQTRHAHCSRTMTTTTKKKIKTSREFPPPISLLARTENLPSHMPFVLKRYYTRDGRLILREEKVRHHEYLRAHRSNGHLTLQLVPLDEDDDDAFDDENEYAQEAQEAEATEEEDEETEELIVQIPESTSSNDNEGIGGMCLKYNNVIMSSSCYLGVPVPAIKPVQT